MRYGRIGRDYIRPRAKIKGPTRRRARTTGAVCLVVLSLLCGCALGPRLEPVAAPADRSVTVAEAGVRLTVTPNTWSAYPGDLVRYFTPIEVWIENAREEELLVRLEDFAALDDSRQQYRAVPPGEVGRALSGGSGGVGPTGARTAVLLAGPWYPHRGRYWGPYYGPYYWPYGPWGYWEPYHPYYWPRAFPQDIVTLGLREGSLLPGASLHGFLYFQQATARGSSLTVSWTPRRADRTALPELAAQFRIVR